MECAKRSSGGRVSVPPTNGGGDVGVASEEAMDLEEDIENGQNDIGHWSGAEEGDHSVSQEELDLKLKDKTIITGLLETMVILWEGSRENLQQSKAKALRGRLVETVGRSLPILFDQFKVRLFKLVNCILQKHTIICTRGWSVVLSPVLRILKYCHADLRKCFFVSVPYSRNVSRVKTSMNQEDTTFMESNF